MNSILVTTDFSKHALYAIKIAASIARKTNAEIKLIHVLNIPSYGLAESHYYHEYLKKIKAQANEKLNSLAEMKFLKGIKIDAHIEKNMLIWKIIKDKEYKDVDLIVIGAFGESGHHGNIIGSNTEKIVRMADAPVLTIKDEHADFKIKKMVFASDFYAESYTVFEKIKFFADLYQAHIHLLKVITPKDFESTPVSRKLIEDFAKKFNLIDSTINIYNAANIENGIADFSDEINADLIAIETHGRTGMTHLINGSLAEDVAKHEYRPVLSIKMKEFSEHSSKTESQKENYENWGAE
jgi:nucleotide-binding universal stress UspA family protein